MSVVFDEIVDKLSLGDAGQEVVADAREDVHHLVHLRSSLSVLLLPSRARIHEEEGEVLGLYAGIASVCDDAAVDGLEPVQSLDEDKLRMHDNSAVLTQQEQGNQLGKQQTLRVSQ